MKKRLIVLSSIGAMALPVLVFAQQSSGISCNFGQNSGTIQAVICKIGEILNTIIPILIVLGVVYFIWGVITYVMQSDEEAKKAGRNRMIYGIIGLVVIVGMWGLVRIVTRTFNIDNQNVGGIVPPCVPGSPGC